MHLPAAHFHCARTRVVLKVGPVPGFGTLHKGLDFLLRAAALAGSESQVVAIEDTVLLLDEEVAHLLFGLARQIPGPGGNLHVEVGKAIQSSGHFIDVV